MPPYMYGYFVLNTQMCVCVCVCVFVCMPIFSSLMMHLYTYLYYSLKIAPQYVSVLQSSKFPLFASKDAHLCTAITKNVTGISESIHILCIVHTH